MFHDLRCVLKDPHFADGRDIAPVPLHAEFEILIWVEAAGIDGELDHDGLPQALAPGGICRIFRITNSAGLSGEQYAT